MTRWLMRTQGMRLRRAHRSTALLVNPSPTSRAMVSAETRGVFCIGNSGELRDVEPVLLLKHLTANAVYALLSVLSQPFYTCRDVFSSISAPPRRCGASVCS